MKRLLFFDHEQAEWCWDLEQMIGQMKSLDRDSMRVYIAKPNVRGQDFWCSFHAESAERNSGFCGTVCGAYQPRNGKNGICKHWRAGMVAHGKPFTITTTTTEAQLRKDKPWT